MIDLPAGNDKALAVLIRERVRLKHETSLNVTKEEILEAVELEAMSQLPSKVSRFQRF